MKRRRVKITWTMLCPMCGTRISMRGARGAKDQQKRHAKATFFASCQTCKAEITVRPVYARDPLHGYALRQQIGDDVHVVVL